MSIIWLLFSSCVYWWLEVPYWSLPLGRRMLGKVFLSVNIYDPLLVQGFISGCIPLLIRFCNYWGYLISHIVQLNIRKERDIKEFSLFIFLVNAVVIFASVICHAFLLSLEWNRFWNRIKFQNVWFGDIDEYKGMFNILEIFIYKNCFEQEQICIVESV